MPKINPRIKSIDDLLGLDAAEERPIEPTPSVSLPTKNTIITLPPQAIRAFRGHPFRLYEGDRLNDLVESISEHGVLNPVIIRKIERDEDGFEYEMLAGHNRQNAAAIANRELPCIVKENLSDEDAWIYVIETNVLQRSFSEMLPSEKAAVLALRYSKMICQGRRNDIVEELKRLENPDEIRENGTCGSDFHKSKSREALGAEYNLMECQWLRYDFDNTQVYKETDGAVSPFQITAVAWAGYQLTADHALKDVIGRISRNETGKLTVHYVCPELQEFFDELKKYPAINGERTIPYFIFHGGDIAKLAYATNEFLYYEDSNYMPLMFRTIDGTLVSDNEFADMGLYESEENVENGTEHILPFTDYGSDVESACDLEDEEDLEI